MRSEPWRTGGFGEVSGELQGGRDNIHDYQLDAIEREQGAVPRGLGEQALVERYLDADQRPLFEIDFLEFSERGNAFDARRADFVKSRIRDYARDIAGVVVIVFVHGWNNNARANNGNVREFRNALATFTKNYQSSIDGRKVVGLYVGWRGAVTALPGVSLLTFWDRKSVAEEIGKGGFTDLVLELEQYDAEQPQRNILLVVGHSFGGAMLLSAYSELLLSRVKMLARHGSLPPQIPVADLLLLLNPAIQANDLFAVKEAIVKHQPWPEHTKQLMTVMSTRADRLTHWAFSLGQFFGTLIPWQQQQLCRPGITRCNVDSAEFPYLHENALDSMTVGNYPPFHTYELIKAESSTADWVFNDLCAGTERQLLPSRHVDAPVFPCSANDPIQFIYTSKDFMRSHGDIFTDQMSAYLESTIRTRLSPDRSPDADPEQSQVNELYRDIYRHKLRNKVDNGSTH